MSVNAEQCFSVEGEAYKDKKLASHDECRELFGRTLEQRGQ